MASEQSTGLDRQTLLKVLETKLRKPSSLEEILSLLGVETTEAEDRVKGCLRDLTYNGEVVAIKGGLFGLAQKLNLVVGIFRLLSRTTGLVTPVRAGFPEIRIPTIDSNGALHGDRVVSRIERRGEGGRFEGSIIRILERANRTLVGRVESTGHYDLIVPVEPKIHSFVMLSSNRQSGLLNGTYVEAQVTGFSSDGRVAHGEIIRNLGLPPDPEIDLQLVSKRHCLGGEFPEVLLRSVPQSGASVSPEDLSSRMDLRRHHCLAFDYEDSGRSIGFSLIEHPKGSTVWLHVPDVAHHIEENSPLDLEARSRGISALFPSQPLPMLPKSFLKSVSLRSGEVSHPALSFSLEFDSEYNLSGWQLHESLIQVSETMPLEAALGHAKQAGDERMSATGKRSLRQLLKIGEELAIRRRKRGSIDFDLPGSETHFDLTDFSDGAWKFSGYSPLDEVVAVANQALADTLTRKKHPFLFRVHGPPHEGEVSLINHSLERLGYSQLDCYEPASFQRLLSDAAGREEEGVIRRMLRKSMRDPKYRSGSLGHYSLALETYASITSPVTRYADLHGQRLAKQFLIRGATDKRSAESTARLEDLAHQLSNAEQRSRDALEDYLQRRQTRAMAAKLGARYSGLITRVESFGFRVELETLPVSGYVRLSTLADDYYSFDPDQFRLCGEASGKTFALGQRLEVRVSHVNLANQQIEFHLDSTDP